MCLYIYTYMQIYMYTNSCIYLNANMHVFASSFSKVSLVDIVHSKSGSALTFENFYQNVVRDFWAQVKTSQLSVYFQIYYL